MDCIVTGLQASMPLVVGYSNFRSQVSGLVCMATAQKALRLQRTAVNVKK